MNALLLFILPLLIDAALEKGVGSVSYGNNCTEVDKLGITWWYNWGSQPDCETKSTFVPMIWGRDNIKDISKVNKSAPALLGFNEPNNAGQSNLSPQEAASYWPQLMATGMRLGSPAVDAGTTAYTWLDQFFGNCSGCRVDFIAVHWYSPWSGSCTAQSLYNRTAFFAERYNRPVWITEFDCADGSFDQNLNFMKQALPNLQSATPKLERFAWFTTRAYGDVPPYYQYVNLFDDKGQTNELGTYYTSV